MENQQNDWKAKGAIMDAAKAEIVRKAPDFYDSYQTMVRVSYAQLKEHGIMEAWLILRGQTEVLGAYDWVTIGQADMLGIIKNPSVE